MESKVGIELQPREWRQLSRWAMTGKAPILMAFARTVDAYLAGAPEDQPLRIERERNLWVTVLQELGSMALFGSPPPWGCTLLARMIAQSASGGE